MQPYAIPFFVFGTLMVLLAAPGTLKAVIHAEATSRAYNVLVFALGGALVALAWVLP